MAASLESRERLQQVLHIAGNEMTSLHQQLSGAGHAVLLTRCSQRDPQLRDGAGRTQDFRAAPASGWVQTGAEACEGTNAIGTCLRGDASR